MKGALTALLALGLVVGAGTALAQRATPKLSPRPAPQQQPAPTPAAPAPVPQQPAPLPGQPQAPAPQPAPAAGGMNAMFLCEAGGRFVVNTNTTGNLNVRDPKTGETAEGTYAYDGKSFRLQVPSYNVNLTSTQLDIQKGLLITFVLPNGYCYLIAHEVGPAVEGYAKCPTIKYLPGVGWEENAFELYQDHSVKWRQWDELVGVGDTLYSETFGVYLIEGNRFYMAFGGAEEDRYLSGTLNADGSFLVDQLEPQKGPCKPS